MFLVTVTFPACSRDTIESWSLGLEEAEAIDALYMAALEARNAVREPRAPAFALIPPNARPGEPVTAAFAFFDEVYAQAGLHVVLLDSRGRRVARAAFFSLPAEYEIKTAIFAVPSTAAIGNAIVRIESAEQIIKELPFVIDPREFRSETIVLDQRNTDLRTLPDPRRTAEAQHVWSIFNRTGTTIYTTEAFILPVSSTRRTSFFGSRRVFQYVDGSSDTAIHAGVDFGVPTGTEVFASATGRVVLARNRLITGYSVILEHLPGIYSLYYHLSVIKVSEGSIVEAGTLLGLSGATGLATGPHLHWEIRVSGENADPDAFLDRPLLDKNAIMTKLLENENS